MFAENVSPKRQRRITRLPANWNWTAVFICMVWAKDVLGEYARAVMMRLPVLGVDDGVVAKFVVYAAVLTLALPEILRCFSFYKILFPLIAGGVYGLTYFVFPENATYLNEGAFVFLLATLPMYFLGLAWNVDRTMKALYYISILTLVCSAFYRIFIGAPMDEETAEYGNDMSGAYSLLPHLCLIGYYALFGEKKVVDWILLIGGTFYLFMLGSRGAVICLLFFLTALVCFLGSGRKRFWSSTLGAGIVFVFSFDKVFYSLLSWISETATRFGLGVRMANQLLEGEFLVSDGRDKIRKTITDALNAQQGAWGYGIYGDRRLSSWDSYAHNLALELWIDFGIVVGSVLLALIAFMVVRRYLISHTQSERAFILLLACCSIGHLMLSSSYLEHGLFFLLLGTCAQSKTARAYANDDNRFINATPPR